MEDLTSMFDSPMMAEPVNNDSLYAPLSQETNICGVGVHLSLIHDPPLYSNSERREGTTRYINVVDSIEKGTPAERAGLRAGDVVIRVNDVDINDGQRLYLPDDVAELIRGPEGTEVTVTVAREDGVRVRAVMVRAPIEDTKNFDASSSRARPSSPISSTVRRAIAAVTPEFVRNLEGFDSSHPMSATFPPRM